MILDRYTLDYDQLASALIRAASKEDCDMVQALLEKCRMKQACRHYRVLDAAEEALLVAAKADRVDVAALIVEKLMRGELLVAKALEKSARNEHEEVTKLLLQSLTQRDPGFLATGHATICGNYVQSKINGAFYSAAERGRVSMVKLLAEGISDLFGDSLVVAATNNHLAVVEVLLELCEERNIPRCEIYHSIDKALSVAQNTEMVQLLTKTKTRYDNCLALTKRQ